MFNNYRLKRAKEHTDTPLFKISARKRRRYIVLTTIILAMSIVTYAICFLNKKPIVPSSFSNNNASLKIDSTIKFEYKSDILTAQRQELNAERIPPKYKINEASVKEVNELNNKLLAFFDAKKQEEYQSLTDNNLKTFLDEKSEELRKSTSFALPPSDIGDIFSLTTEKSRERIFKRTSYFVKNILKDGVYDDDDKAFVDSENEINPISNVNQSTSKHAVSETNARLELWEKIKSDPSIDKRIQRILNSIFNQIIKPNVEYDAEATKQKRDEARAKVKPVVVKIREGETLADNVSIHTPLGKERLEAYRKEMLNRNTNFNNAPNFVNFIVCILLILLAVLFITISKSQSNKKAKTIYIFCFLLLLNLVAQRIIIEFANTQNVNNHSLLPLVCYATPIILGPIIQVLLFGSYLGFIMAILVSSLSTLMLGQGTPFFVLSLTASVVAIYFCDGATNRARVIITGVVYGVFVAVVASIIGLLREIPAEIIAEQACITFFGGIITSLLALIVLPIFEILFKHYSNISLLDYTDLNNKKANLLKKLQIVAPGTYHHSVMVSYIAEAAAQAVKANSMVCRVGALYHDIGKLSKPEFFAENQSETNPHDEQNPSMSALIIKNHVSDGVAKAEVEKMPHQIIDAISQHHGNSIIAYFYNKAKKKAGQKVISTDDINQILREEGIEENTYRHQGEKPKTVENAIIMIADSCEAASRSMKKITKHGIETLVDVIVNAKMTDGQFDECPITVKQISIIKKNVVQTLLNINHTRVDYKQD